MSVKSNPNNQHFGLFERKLLSFIQKVGPAIKN
jgi:hypothetical protein